MQKQNSSELLTVREVASRLSVSTRTVYGLIRSGALRAVAIGPRATRVDAAEVERYIRDAGGGGAS